MVREIQLNQGVADIALERANGLMGKWSKYVVGFEGGINQELLSQVKVFERKRLFFETLFKRAARGRNITSRELRNLAATGTTFDLNDGKQPPLDMLGRSLMAQFAVIRSVGKLKTIIGSTSKLSVTNDSHADISASGSVEAEQDVIVIDRHFHAAMSDVAQELVIASDGHPDNMDMSDVFNDFNAARLAIWAKYPETGGNDKNPTVSLDALRALVQERCKAGKENQARVLGMLTTKVIPSQTRRQAAELRAAA